MKKARKVIFFLIMLGFGLVTANIKTTKAEEELEQVYLDLEYMTEEEAVAFLKDYIGLPETFSIDEINGTVNVVANSSTIDIGFTTTSTIGIASEIGVKLVYIQNREPGGNIYGSQIVPGNFYTTNSYGYMGGLTVKNPEVGREYRVKLTHYIIVDGVQYSFTFATDPLLFTGN